MITKNKILFEKWLTNHELCIVIISKVSQIQSIKTDLDNITEFPIRGIVYSNNKEMRNEMSILLRKSRIYLQTKKQKQPTSLNTQRRNNIIYSKKKPMDSLVQTNTAGLRCGTQNIVLQCNRKGDQEFNVVNNPSHMNSHNVKQLLSTYMIPKTYEYVEICNDQTKLQFVGKDNQNRWQYHYSKEWKMQQELLKIKNLCHMDDDFWKVLNKNIHHLLHASKPWSKEKLLATATGLLIACHFRPHWPQQTKKQQTKETHYGLTTMLKSHVTLNKHTPSCIFNFIGKSGKENKCSVLQQNELLNVCRQLKLNGNSSDPFLSFKPSTHQKTTTITAKELVAFLKPYNIHPKDFRTYYANLSMIQSLMHYHDPYQFSHFQRATHIKDGIKSVSIILNNTPAISKQDYVFTGLYMLYQIKPFIFSQMTTNKAASEALLEIFRLFIDKKYDWRDMQQQYTFVTKPGKQSEILKVILIGDTNLSKLDKTQFSNVNHVICSNKTNVKLLFPNANIHIDKSI